MATPLPDLAALLAQLAQALAEQNRQSEPPSGVTGRPTPTRVLLTVDEAAEQLGIGRTLTWRLVSNGELESVQIGRLRRVPTTAITNYATQLIARQSARKTA
jgi:excisionase family DNA binding protein